MEFRKIKERDKKDDMEYDEKRRKKTFSGGVKKQQNR